MALSTKARDILKVAVADRGVGKEIADAIDASAWTTSALEITTTTAASAAFAKALKSGDVVIQTAAIGGATSFAAVTANGTVPGGLTIASGDLLRAMHKAPAQAQNLTADEANPLGLPS